MNPTGDRLRKTVDEMRQAIESVLDWLENAPIDYENGVTWNGMDEGRVRGWEGHSAIVRELQAAIGFTPPTSVEQAVDGNPDDWMPF